MPAPKHIAIIMDGNGRWAKTHGHHRFFGHVRGARVAKSIIEASAEKGLKYLTLFAFSTENWLRPNEEVHLLMRLLFSRLKREGTNLVKNNIRFRCIGDLNRLPAFVREVVLETLAKTRHCTGMTLVFALSYGGRQEITWAVREIAHLVKAGEISPEEIDDQVLSEHLESSFLPDPDLVIRTGGESRISNFYLWQAAYSEIMVIKKMWPEFKISDLDDCIRFFSNRERRYGKTSEQVRMSLVDPCLISQEKIE